MAKLIPLDEAAELLGISPDELGEMRSRNEIHGYRDGSSWKFKESEIDRVKASLGSSDFTSATDDDDGFDLTLADEPATEDSDDMLILDDDGPEGLDLEGGSDIGLGTEDLTLGDPASGTSSGLSLTDEPDDELSLEDDDDELNLVEASDEDDSEMILADAGVEDDDRDDIDLGDELQLDEPGVTADFSSEDEDSEISLSAASEADFDLGEDSGDDDMFDMSDEVSGTGDEDFLLTPVEAEGDFDEEDSGSQVIALDSDSLSSDSALFGSSSGDEEGISIADNDMSFVGVESTGPTAVAQQPTAMQPAEPPYTTPQVISLMLTAGLILLCGLMVFDLIWHVWSFDEPFAINSTIMDFVLSMMGT